MNLFGIINKSKDLFKQTRQNLKTLKERRESQKVFTMPEITAEEEWKAIESIIHISSTSAVKSTLSIIAILLLWYFLYSISHLLILFFISLFLAATLDPAVDFLENYWIPRWIWVILLFLVIIAFIILIFWSMVPIVVEQISVLVTDISQKTMEIISNFQQWNSAIPYVWDKINSWVFQTIQSINIESIAEELTNNFTWFAKWLEGFAKWSLQAVWGAVWAWASVAWNVLGFLMDLILVLFLTFFMVTDRENLNLFFRSLFPPKYSKYIETKTHDIQHQIWSWIRWQMILMVIMFTVSYFWLLIIWMQESWITLALIMWIWEFLPYIWPIIFLIVSLPIALNLWLLTVVKLLVLYSILQFIEWNILVPVVMKKAVWLSPIVVLLVILIWFQFLWVIWAIIAVPVSTAISIFIKDYISLQAKKAS